MSNNKWIDKQVVVYSFNKMLNSNKIKILTAALTWIKHKIFIQGSRSQAKKQTIKEKIQIL